MSQPGHDDMDMEQHTLNMMKDYVILFFFSNDGSSLSVLNDLQSQESSSLPSTNASFQLVTLNVT